jgi:mercuric ion binding protein
MKTLRLFPVLFIAFFCLTANAQSGEPGRTETVKVFGNCEMCKGRIEKAARTAGAVSADWDVDSKILSVSYPAAGTSLGKIEKAIAGAGYDTVNETAAAKAYKALPECCQYERKSIVESNKN